MAYRFSIHAEQQIARRGIPKQALDNVLSDPEQRIQQEDGTEIRQARVASENGKMYLIRVVVDITKEPETVITAYRSSKIAKYWRPE